MLNRPPGARIAGILQQPRKRARSFAWLLQLVDVGVDSCYWVADFSPSRRMRSCSFLRRFDGAFGLKATRYQRGCERSRARRMRVAASLFGCRAMFSRIAE